MGTTPTPGLKGQSTLRTTLRVVGVVLLVAGLAFLAMGVASFFSAFSSTSGSPSHFWMAFVGILLLAPGAWCLQAGFLGTASRFVAGETMPVVKDSASYLSDGRGILGVGRADSEPAAAGPFCSRCGTRNDADASFCDGCGSALAR